MSINNKRSYTEYTVVQPTTDFAIGFDDFDEGSKDNILVTLNGVLVETLGYAAIRKNESTVTITPAITEGTVRLTRETDIDEPFHKFTAGALFSAKSMDENFQQVRHSQQEVRDGFVFLEYNTNGIVQASKEATAQAKAATVEATASAVRAESAADTAVQAVGSLQGVVNAATTATTNANIATASATTAASQATAATTSAQNATQAATTAKQEATTAAANANAATVDTLSAIGRANEAADVVAGLVVGKVRAQDVSTVDGSTQDVKNTEFRNELDGLPFVDGFLPTTKATYLNTAIGAVNRSLDDKLKDIISIKDFGAVGDGVTDDRDALQAAFNAAEGGLIVIPPSNIADGEYLCNGLLSIKSNTVVLGAGGVIKLGGGQLTGIMLKGAEFVRMLGVSINGNLDAMTDYNSTVLGIYGSSNIVIDGCHIYDGVQSGIEVGQRYFDEVGYNKNVKIINNTVERIGKLNHPIMSGDYAAYGNGISVTGGEDILIQGNSVYDIYSVGGINLEGTKVSKVNIVDNIVGRLTGKAAGIKAYAGGSDVDAEDIVIRNNVIFEQGDSRKESEPAIWIRAGANVLVEGNIIRDCPNSFKAGQITVDRDATCRIINNTIYNCDNAQIYVNTAKDIIVQNNVVNCTVNQPPETDTYVIESTNAKDGTLSITGNIARDSKGFSFTINARSAGTFTGNSIINPNSTPDSAASVIRTLTSFGGSIVGNNVFYIPDISVFQASFVYSFSGAGFEDMKYLPDVWRVDLEALTAAGKSCWDVSSNNAFIQSEIALKTSAPTVGYNTKGRVLLNADSVAGGYIGWACIASGTPGVWKGFGKIDAT